MKLKFEKLHGLGNDFILIEDLKDKLSFSSDQVKAMCDRHFGIGADGVILIKPTEMKDCVARMININADGSVAQMCGNGLRCFAKYLVDHEMTPRSYGGISVETAAGVREVEYGVDIHGKLSHATVDMGEPQLDPRLIPVRLETNADYGHSRSFVCDYPLDSPWGEFRFTCISMGNPHAICFMDDFNELDDDLFDDSIYKNLDTFDIGRIGAFFESHPVFPERSSIEFAICISEGIRVRVFDRGCGETLACGTGACAVGVAAALTGRGPRENKIYLPGGVLDIDWASNNHVMMSGSTQYVYAGTYEIPEL